MYCIVINYSNIRIICPFVSEIMLYYKYYNFVLVDKPGLIPTQ